MIAYRNGYPLLCAPFDTVKPPVASLLWLFYLSKVRYIFRRFRVHVQSVARECYGAVAS